MRQGAPHSLGWAASVVGGELWGTDSSLPLPVAVDSRQVVEGGAFLALCGAHDDGHRFVGDALGRGGAIFFGEREKIAPWRDRIVQSGGGALAFSGDSEASFVRLAQHYLLEIDPPTILAITGSVGKTTCRELVASALDGPFKIHQASKSHNTALGCALTILAMPPSTEVLILEMGCNHRGEISEMVDLFPPDIAVITEVVPAHLEGLGDIEGVLQAKLEILRSSRLKAMSYNIDNALLREAVAALPAKIDLLSVGYHSEAAFRLIKTTQDRDEKGFRLVVRAQWREEEILLNSRLFGRHQAYSMGFAGAIASYLGVEDLDGGFGACQNLAGRGRVRVRPQGGLVVDESYNANPLSMRAALVAFDEAIGGKRSWALLGEMGELGPDSATFHRLLLEEAPLPEQVLLLGEAWGDPLPPGARHVADVDEAIAILAEEMAPDAGLLVKGSRFWGLERVVRWALSS